MQYSATVGYAPLTTDEPPLNLLLDFPVGAHSAALLIFSQDMHTAAGASTCSRASRSLTATVAIMPSPPRTTIARRVRRRSHEPYETANKALLGAWVSNNRSQ